jgi:hypothetical protein
MTHPNVSRTLLDLSRNASLMLRLSAIDNATVIHVFRERIALWVVRHRSTRSKFSRLIKKLLRIE